MIFTRSGSFDTDPRVWITSLLAGKISRGRHHKNYVDKSKIGSTRNPEKNSHKIFTKCKKSLLLKTSSISKVQKTPILFNLKLKQK